MVCALILSYLPATDLYFRFRTITLVNINGFSRNLVCALILKRSDLGLLIGKFGKFLAATHPYFRFRAAMDVHQT